jgi:hypothetical protein
MGSGTTKRLRAVPGDGGGLGFKLPVSEKPTYQDLANWFWILIRH